MFFLDCGAETYKDNAGFVLESAAQLAVSGAALLASAYLMWDEKAKAPALRCLSWLGFRMLFPNFAWRCFKFVLSKHLLFIWITPRLLRPPTFIVFERQPVFSNMRAHSWLCVAQLVFFTWLVPTRIRRSTLRQTAGLGFLLWANSLRQESGFSLPSDFSILTH